MKYLELNFQCAFAAALTVSRCQAQVLILVYIEYIAKKKKIPTGTRNFSLRLLIPERVLFEKGIQCREQRCGKIGLIDCHLKLTGKLRAQHRRPKLQRDDHVRDKRHIENIRVCMGIFTTSLRR